MALINCPKCGKQVSSFAPACPNCGCAINAICGGDIVKKPVDDESFAFDFSAVEGTLLYEAGLRRVKMILAAEEIEFRDATYVSDWPGSDKAESVYLNYSQVRNFRFSKQMLAVRKEKFVVGGAMLGLLPGLFFVLLGLLALPSKDRGAESATILFALSGFFGWIGPVVGAIAGTTKKFRRGNFLVIDYISQDGEKSSLSLDCYLISSQSKEKLSKLLKERCPNILSSNRL